MNDADHWYGCDCDDCARGRWIYFMVGAVAGVVAAMLLNGTLRAWGP